MDQAASNKELELIDGTHRVEEVNNKEQELGNHKLKGDNINNLHQKQGNKKVNHEEVHNQRVTNQETVDNEIIQKKANFVMKQDETKENDELEEGESNNELELEEGSHAKEKEEGNNEFEQEQDINEVEHGEGSNEVEHGVGNNEVEHGEGSNEVEHGEGNNEVEHGEGNNEVEHGVGNNEVEHGEGNNDVEHGESNNDVEHGEGNNEVDHGEVSNEVDQEDQLEQREAVDKVKQEEVNNKGEQKELNYENDDIEIIEEKKPPIIDLTELYDATAINEFTETKSTEVENFIKINQSSKEMKKLKNVNQYAKKHNTNKYVFTETKSERRKKTKNNRFKEFIYIANFPCTWSPKMMKAFVCKNAKIPLFPQNSFTITALKSNDSYTGEAVLNFPTNETCREVFNNLKNCNCKIEGKALILGLEKYSRGLYVSRKTVPTNPEPKKPDNSIKRTHEEAFPKPNQNLQAHEKTIKQKDKPVNQNKIPTVKKHPLVNKLPNVKISYITEPATPERYGLSVEFLESLGIPIPIMRSVSVKNLHNYIDKDKLMEVFSLAGCVKDIKICKGFLCSQALITYDHPVEAVQAISMFNKQLLFNRHMEVKMDTYNKLKNIALPLGLSAVGQGLGKDGLPLSGVRSAMELKKRFQEFEMIFQENISQNLMQAMEQYPTNSRNVSTSPNPISSDVVMGIETLINQVQSIAPHCSDIVHTLKILQNQTDALRNTQNMGNLLAEQRPGPFWDTRNVGQPNPKAQRIRNEASPNIPPYEPDANERPQNIDMIDQQLEPTRPPRLPTFLTKPPHAMPTNNVHAADEPIVPPCDTVPPKRNPAQYGGITRSSDKRNRIQSKSVPRQENTIHMAQGRHRERSSSEMLVFSNLSWKVSTEVLIKKMEEVGELDYCEVVGLGRAYVCFHNLKDAENCIKLFHHSKVDGQTMDVRFYQSQ